MMSHGKEIAYVEERLRAIERDVTFKFGALALQLKKDLGELRMFRDQLNARVERLERANTEKLNGSSAD